MNSILKDNKNTIPAKGAIRYAQLDGVDMMVVPVVLMTPGVYNNILYTDEGLAKSAESYNGRPVVVSHPQKPDGTETSANNPVVWNQTKVGVLFNVSFTDNKLKGEAWIDPAKANEVSPGLTDLIVNKGVEVSTGVNLVEDKSEGAAGNDTYSAIALNQTGDHLAILPNGGAACSWSDGAGMPRVNSKKEIVKVEPTVLDRAKVWIEAKLADNAKQYQGVMQALNEALREQFPQGYPLIEDLDGNQVIFSIINANNAISYRRCGYKEKDKQIKLGNSEEVKREIVFSTVEQEPKANQKTKGGHMDAKSKELADSLVGNAALGLTADDGVKLAELDSALLAKLQPKVVPPAPAPKANSFAELLEQAGDGIKAQAQDALGLLKDKRDGLVASLLGNANNSFKKEELEGRSTGELVALNKLAGNSQKDVVRAGAPAGTLATNADEAYAPITPMDLSKK